jgi:hypothetical protein
MVKTGFRLGLGRVVLLVFPACSLVAQQPGDTAFTPSDRWKHYVHRTYGPVRLGLLAIDSAFDQALLRPSCWDSGAASYGRRYTRSFERRVIRNTAELGAGLLTGEDLRFRPSGSRVFHARIWNSLRSSVTARMPDGTTRPAYTRFFATALTDVSTAHWTGERIRPEWLMTNLAWSALDQMQVNLLDEFGPDLRRIGNRIWRRAHRVRR